MNGLRGRSDAEAVATALMALCVHQRPDPAGLLAGDERCERQFDLCSALGELMHLLDGEEAEAESLDEALERLREQAAALQVAQGVAEAYVARANAIRAGDDKAREAATAQLIAQAPNDVQARVNDWCRGPRAHFEPLLEKMVSQVCRVGPAGSGALAVNWLGPDRDFEATITVAAMGADGSPHGLAGALMAACRCEPDAPWPSVAEELCAERLEWSRQSPIEVRFALLEFMNYEPVHWLDRLAEGGRLVEDEQGPVCLVSEPLSQRRPFDAAGDKWDTSWTILALERSWLALFSRVPV